jgi:thioester reductase-like protein
VLEDYLEHGSRVLALVRPREGLSPRERLEGLLDKAELPASFRSRVTPLESSIEEPGFGLGAADRRRLQKEAELFIHSAAVTHLGASAEECHRANVEGTRRALALGRELHAQGRLQRFAYISSYAASGTARSGYFQEDSLPSEPAFANEYERTKYMAEREVRQAMAELPAVIFRPSVTVGDTQTGRIAHFNLFYQVVRILGSGMLSHWPDLRERTVNIVPVDYVARGFGRGLGGGAVLPPGQPQRLRVARPVRPGQGLSLLAHPQAGAGGTVEFGIAESKGAVDSSPVGILSPAVPE